MSHPIRHALLLGLAGALALPAVGSAAVGDVTEFPVTGGGPQAITSGPDGNLWIGQYTEVLPTTNSLSGIGRVTPSGTFTGFTAGIPNDSAPLSIASGPDGNLWFTEAFNPVPALARSTTAGAVTPVSTFPVPANAYAQAVIAGPDGNMWLSIVGSVVRATTGGAVSTFALPGAVTLLTGLAAGSDGNVWGIAGGEDALTRTTPAGVTVIASTFAAGSNPGAITSGPDGNLWVTLRGTTPPAIARITTSGTVTTFPVTSGATRLKGITSGPDGNLWFTEEDSGRVGRITPSGQVTEYVIPRSGATPLGITAGPDGNVWYADPGGRVGRVLTGVVPTGVTAPSVSGRPKVGTVLTVSNGTWKYLPTGHAYSWQRCTSAAGAGCVAISGATSSSYTVTTADIGRFLIASVVASNSNGASAASIAPAVQVAAVPRLAVTWSRTTTKRKKATVTGLVTLRSGVTGYRMNAVLTSGPNAYRSDANTRSGRCVRVKVKVGPKTAKKPRTVARQRCSITLPVGAWTVSVEGSRGPELMGFTSKAYRIR